MIKRNIIIPIILATFVTAIYACSPNKNAVKEQVEDNLPNYTESANETKALLDSKCMVCHGIKESQDEMLAPPFAHIQKKYSKVSSSKESFIESFVDFTLNPNEDQAMMFGALKQFNLMPNLGFERTEVEKIALYVYEHEFPEPKWCN